MRLAKIEEFEGGEEGDFLLGNDEYFMLGNDELQPLGWMSSAALLFGSLFVLSCVVKPMSW